MRERKLAVWLVVALALACSDRRFRGGEASSGGRAGGGADGGGAGSGGAGAGTGGSAGAAAGSGGSAGTDGCDCAPTTYCRSGVCLPCSELSTLDFGDPELLLDHPSVPIRFPRSGDGAESLFFRAGDEGQGQLWYTPDTRQLGAFIGDPMASQQSAPLFVPALGHRFNFVFDELVNGTRTIRGATWSGALGPDSDLPAPLSPGGFQDYSPAIAVDTGRVHWMSTRDGSVTLRTGVLDSGEGDVVAIEVPKRNGSGHCPLTNPDLTPWVTPDGRRLFFREFPYDDDCTPIDATTTELFVVPLEPSTGQPTQPALLLPSVSRVGSTETDPSLSSDLCTLYFASDAVDSDFKLFRAPRR